MATKRYSTQDLILAVKNSYSYAEVLSKLGLRQAGGTQACIKKKINNLNLDTTHFHSQLWSKGKTVLDDDRIGATNKEDIFTYPSKASSGYVRPLILKKNIIAYRCFKCENVGEWNGNKLNLQLDHINGIREDQRLENLRFLCPNCHSQTETFGSKNRKYQGKQKVTDEQIIEAFYKYKGKVNQMLKGLGIPNGRNYARIYRVILDNNLKIGD